MLTYVRLGHVNFSKGTRLRGVVSRPEWEFEACLSGKQGVYIPAATTEVELCEMVLWAFPKGHVHGWRAPGPSERVVFHFSGVPGELERNVPDRGYYKTSLSRTDCSRLRAIARAAMDMVTQPTTLRDLLYSNLLSELSLFALREVPTTRLSLHASAQDKVKAAESWYRDHIEEHPSYRDVASAVHVSPSYLRSLFHIIRAKSPKAAFIKLRMEYAAELLCESGLKLEDVAEHVGFSCGSALSRAMKDYFGVTPRQLRTRKSWAPASARRDM